MQVVNKYMNEMARYGRCGFDPRAFVIMDDLLYCAEKWKKDPFINSVFMNGRHYKLLYILALQYPIGIGPNLRTNIDYTFILRNPVPTERKKIFDHYAGMFPSFEAFCQIMDACTDNYECLVIDNTVQSNNMLDCVFWYKADDHPPFKIGSREFWEMSKNFDDGDGGPENIRQKKRNQTNFNIQKIN
jgi:hypothetical protein